MKHVCLVFDRLRQYNFYVKLLKCTFLIDEVDFLRYRVGVKGVLMDMRRVTIIQEWPVLDLYRDIQVFLGFANFYRWFIHRYSVVVTSMTDLLKDIKKGRKKGPFLWTEDTKKAFYTL